MERRTGETSTRWLNNPEDWALSPVIQKPGEENRPQNMTEVGSAGNYPPKKPLWPVSALNSGTMWP